MKCSTGKLDERIKDKSVRMLWFHVIFLLYHCVENSNYDGRSKASTTTMVFYYMKRMHLHLRPSGTQLRLVLRIESLREGCDQDISIF